MGRGGESSTGPRSSFYWDKAPEPHAQRKADILKAHPEINQLMGPCPYTKYQIAFVVSLQMGMAYVATFLPWKFLVPLAWVFGGAANCNLQLAMHEISHNLAFKATTPLGLGLNRALSIVANLPLGIPAAISFRKYHMEHHRYQGHDVVDVDIPCEWEGWFFTSPAKKLCWVMLQPAFYALRPLFTYPLPMQGLEVVNLVTSLAFDYAVFSAWGAKALAYLLLGTLLGMGLHPTAFHFISEHCVFEEGAETYSYYGPLNAIMYNVGYHNEHHDFPNVPGSRLAMVRKLAPEFYDHLPHHTSWLKVFQDYLFRADITPYARVKRSPATPAAREAAAKAPAFVGVAASRGAAKGSKKAR